MRANKAQLQSCEQSSSRSVCLSTASAHKSAVLRVHLSLDDDISKQPRRSFKFGLSTSDSRVEAYFKSPIPTCPEFHFKIQCNIDVFLIFAQGTSKFEYMTLVHTLVVTQMLECWWKKALGGDLEKNVEDVIASFTIGFGNQVGNRMTNYWMNLK